jgi:hypothetical protein
MTMLDDHTATKILYAAPQLQNYGVFSKLTASGSNGGREGTGVGNISRRA